jgi:hypothetical protein
VITPADIRKKATRLYLPFLRSWLKEEPFFPQVIPVGKLPSDYVELRKSVHALQAQSKERHSHGYTLDYQVLQKRFSGKQTVPARAILETEHDFLWLIEKEEEFDLFRQDVMLLRDRLPQLGAWLERNPQKMIEHHGLWADLFAVCRYFLDHPRPNLYLRELPINVHTKFIEQHRGIVRELLEQLMPQEEIPQAATTFEQRFGLHEKEPLVRLRLLNEQLYNHYRLPLNELSVPVSQLEVLDLLRGQRCIVTENEMTFLALPRYKDTFALFGGGFMVRNLEAISWLALCPIIYWGDLDAQGFQILSSLRAFFPHVVSVMMDWESLCAFSGFCVASTPCPIRQLPHLTYEEHALFLHLVENNLRLEQEHISHAYAIRQLNSILTETEYQN